MGNRDEMGPRPFNWRRTRRTALVTGTAAGTATVLAKVAAVVIVAEPVTMAAILTVSGIYFVCTASSTVAAEYVNHRLDDPSPVFDARTTTLYDLVGLTFGFLLFVIPAMQLEHALRPGQLVPGPMALLAFCLTAFGVTISRGLLVNLGLVRNSDDRRDTYTAEMR